MASSPIQWCILLLSNYSHVTIQTWHYKRNAVGFSRLPILSYESSIADNKDVLFNFGVQDKSLVMSHNLFIYFT